MASPARRFVLSLFLECWDTSPHSQKCNLKSFVLGLLPPTVVVVIMAAIMIVVVSTIVAVIVVMIVIVAVPAIVVVVMSAIMIVVVVMRLEGLLNLLGEALFGNAINFADGDSPFGSHLGA